jgi:hypothetical protein
MAYERNLCVALVELVFGRIDVFWLAYHWSSKTSSKENLENERDRCSPNN